jgi:DamX protein
LPFSPAQLGKLFKMSGGLPAEVNHIGAELIERLESGKNASGSPRFPVAHGLLVVLLVVVVSLAYLVLSGPVPDGDEADARVSRLDLPGSSASASGSTAMESGAEAIEDEAVAIRDEARTRPDATDLMRDDERNDGEAGREIVALPGTVVGARDVTGSNIEGSQESPPPTGSAPAPRIVDRESVPKPEAAASGTPAVPEAGSGVPAGLAGNLVQRVPAQTRDAGWLLQQPADRFTVQLVSFSTQDRLVAYLGEQRRAELFAWYPVERGGKRLYVVTWGQFGTKAEAEAAAKALPAETGKVEPWIRPMRLVQEAIRSGPDL